MVAGHMPDVEFAEFLNYWHRDPRKMVTHQPGGPDGTVAHQVQICGWTLCFTDKGIGNTMPYIYALFGWAVWPQDLGGGLEHMGNLSCDGRFVGVSDE